MLRFICNFSIGIFLLTVFNDRSIGIGIMLILLCVPLFRARSFRSWRKYALITIIAFILCNLSYLIYESKFSAEVVSSSIISTWQITADLGGDKYAFENQQGSRYLMSKTGHTLGQSIRLVASVAQNKQITTWSDLRYQWFNFPKRLRMKWYVGALYETNSISIGSWSSLGRLVTIRQTVHNQIVRSMTHPNGQQSSALAWALWMFVWDKSWFSDSMYQLLIQSWLVHLVAVSGGNIVMLVTFLTFILFFIPFYPRLVVLLLAIISYWLLCGMDSSVVRAVIMWSLSILALLLWRPNLIRRALALSFIAMLIYNPYFLMYDVWFLLSFWAVVGIVLFEESTVSKNFSNNEEKPKLSKSRLQKILLYPRKNYIKPGIWAMLWIFPVLLFYMDKINLTSIIGNLFVLPMVPLLMIGSMIQIFIPSYMSEWTLRILEHLSARIDFVANMTVRYGVIISSEDLLVKYLLIGIFVMLLVVYHRRFSAVGGVMPTPVNHKKQKRQAIKRIRCNYG